jgi:hypothetical protein
MPAQWRTGATHVQSVVVETCWRPMTGDVAGDFHDVLDLRDGRVAVVVGDAMGFGPDAAEMAELLRSHARNAVQQSTDPAAVLVELDRALAAEGDEKIATAACVLLDPAGGVARMSNAGHLPALFVDGAAVELFDGAPDPPLGLAAERRSVERRFSADTSMFLYTDGLIERRGIAIDEAIDQLVRSSEGLGGASAWASELARRATDVFGTPTDDATVVSVRIDQPVDRGLVAGPQRVALRLYLDPRDMRSNHLHDVAVELASSSPTLDVHVEVIDVTERSNRTEDAGVLAAPTVIRVLPEPAVRAIGWFDTPEELARALQLPRPQKGHRW